jgi:hypothetical protein
LQDEGIAVQSDQVNESPSPPRVYPYAPESNVIRTRSTAATVGLVLAGVAALFGLFILGGIVLMLVLLNSWGSNK